MIHWVSYLVFGIYVIILGYLGYMGWRRTKRLSEFAVAERVISPILIGICLASTAISAVVFLGFPGWAYAGGVSPMWNSCVFWPAMALGLWVMAKKFRRVGDTYGSLTLPDWLGHRFNSDWVRLVASVLILFLLFHIAGQLTGIAILFKGILGTTILWGLIIGTVIIVGYIMFGGMYSDIYTDAVQGVLMAVMGAIIFGVFWVTTGGFTGATASLNAIDPNLTMAINPKFFAFKTPLSPFTHMIFAFSFVTLPYMANKIFALRRERDIKVAVITFSVCTFFYYMMPFGGLAGRIILPAPLERADTVIPELISYVFHPAFAAILLVVILCAAMSTVDGLYHAISSCFAVDIYQRILVKRGMVSKARTPEEVERIGLWIGRILLIVIGIGVIFWVRVPPAYIALISTIGLWGYMAGCVGPVMLGLYWKGTTKWGALVGLICGPLIYWLVANVPPFQITAATIWTHGSIGCVSAAFLVWIVSLLTKKSAIPEAEFKRMMGE